MIVNELFFYWIIIAFLFLIFEIGHPGLFFFLSFSLGAIGGAITTFFSPSVAMQSIVFLMSSMCALLVLRKWAVRQASIHYASHKTNIDALQGKRAITLSIITATHPGFVKIGGETWLAKSNEHIEKGELVEVIMVQGAHVIVKKRI